MSVYTTSGALKISGDRAGNLDVRFTGSVVNTAASYINFSGSAIQSVTSDGSGVTINIASGSSASTATSSSFTKGVTFLDPVFTKDVVVWRSDGNYTLTNIRGFFSGTVGAASASVNATKNSTITHLTSTLSLNTNNTWINGSAIISASYSPGDYLQIRLLGLSGSIYLVTIQADFTNP